MVRRICCTLIALLGSNACFSSEMHDLTKVHGSVFDFLNRHFPVNEQRHSVKITVNNFDSRLKLSQCDNALTHNLLSRDPNGGQLTVQTQCEGSQPWSIYVPAEVIIEEMVVVAKTDLLRGVKLHASHLELQPRKASSRGQNGATNIMALVGKQLKRSLRKGEKIRLSSLTNPTAIKRGDFVSVIASSGSITVVTRGTAMSAGRVGEQIKVRNNKTERVIKGEITAPGKVKVIL